MKDKKPLPTKDRLIRAASELFRKHGYHGVGLSDLLAKAEAPKGSLYHHFPNGKSDLARAAADRASDQILRILANCFAEAPTFKDGAKALCDRLAEAFDQSGMWETCPVAATLFEGPDNDEFRAHAAHLYEGWIAEVHDHAERLGMDQDTAQAAAEHLFVLLQGSWMLARARRSSDVLRELPERL